MTAQPFTRDWLRDMALSSLTDPRKAAGDLLSLDIPRQALWTWLALVAALNGLLYAMTMPAQMQLGMPMPGFMRSPLLIAVGMGGLMLVMTQFLVLAGRMLGGGSDFFQMLLVTCWLQSLRVAFQAVVTLLTTLSPGLGAVLAVIGGFWGIYVLANFLTVAHRFETPLKAIAVMVIAVLATAFALSFILAILGVTPEGGA